MPAKIALLRVPSLVFNEKTRYHRATMGPNSSRLYQWALRKAGSPKSSLWIGLLFSLELFLFVPLDAVLMFFCLQNRSKILLYVAIATIASTLSATLGYLTGHFLWDLIGHVIVPHFISTAQFDRISTHFQTYEHWAVFFGAFFPFPLKALSLTAGVFHLGALPFALGFAAARLCRFLLVGGAMAIWGEKVKTFVEKHFHRILMLVGAKVAIALIFFWALAR